ncbi:MAG: hypothetical protein WCJ39_01705 [bacterium]
MCNQTLNTSFISAQEVQPALHSEALFLCYTPNTNLSITKVVNKNVFSLGENVLFSIVITNNGPDIASNVQI